MSCWKVCYSTWRHAAWDARQLRRHKRSRLGKPEAYWCRVCRCAHVGRRDAHQRRRVVADDEGAGDG